jgi:hypothetical protein
MCRKTKKNKKTKKTKKQNLVLLSYSFSHLTLDLPSLIFFSCSTKFAFRGGRLATLAAAPALCFFFFFFF